MINDEYTDLFIKHFFLGSFDGWGKRISWWKCGSKKI